MSYILEALKKADQERNIGAVPDLESTHEPVHRKKRPYGWIWFVAPLLIVNGVLLYVLLTRQDADVPATTLAPLEQQSGVVNDRPQQPVPQADKTRIEPAPRQAIAAPAPERSPRLAAGKPAEIPGEPEVAPKTAVPSRPEPPVMTTQPAAPPAAPAPEPPVLRREQPVAKAVTATAGAGTLQVPHWDELSLELRSRITLPRLDVHVHSEEQRRRFILVDLNKYREGETLESGLVLEKILPDGIILSHEGQPFRVEK